ncbi:MAG TPA: choice-of-anchor Q domain-containing protein [Solirubrobacterales bacterium]|nr:choice-of-anchor Q domain-containing protein [Solirubrobacterales bacterium]
MRFVRPPLLVLAVVAAVLLPATPAAALPFPVTSTADDETKGTLRSSIKEANANSGPDTIPIEVTGTIDLQSPLQIIFDPVSIIGPHADLLEVHRADSAAFPVFAFSATDPSAVSGLTISNGRAIASGGFVIGGGIRNSEGSLTLTGVVVKDSEAAGEGGTNVFVEGGGIFSEGPLTLRETVVAGNAARASNATSLTAAFGGGVAALGNLTVEASTISGNVTEASGDGSTVTAQGGGVLAGTAATVSRSTISGNAVIAGGAAPQVRAQGGGIQTYEATLTSSTLARNSATSAGLALAANLYSALSTTVRGTLVADPLDGADSCGGGAPGSDEIASGGFNLDEDDSCGFAESSDLVGVVAGLDPVLKDNGGPTPTHALLAGSSAAIDRGYSFGSSVDQRGLARPSDFPAIGNTEGGDGSDIGAFELQVPPTPDRGSAVIVSQRPTDKFPPNTRILSGPPRVTFKTRAKFRFASTEGQSRFQCKLDKKRWKGCRNPYKRSVKPGKHLFKVRAIDRFGNVDPTPARFGWRVKPIVG